MADRTFEVNITTAVQAPYAIKKVGYAGEHNATAIQINLPAEYIGGFTYSLDVTTGAGESYKYPVILGDGDDFLIFEVPHPLTDKGALDLTLKITETITQMLVKSRGINLQFIGRDINTYAELADNYVPDATATEDCLNAAVLANEKAGVADAAATSATDAAAHALSARDQAEENVAAALETMEENLATFEDVTEAITNAQSATDVANASSTAYTKIAAQIDGITLPNNKVTNEGLSGVRNILSEVLENVSSPGIRIVADTDSPMSNKMLYKREIYETTAHASNLYRRDKLPDLTSDTSSICIGYWVKDSEVATIFSTARNMIYWLYTSTGYIEDKFLIGDLISSVGNTATVTKGGDTGMIASHNATAVCMAKENGYSYVKLYITGISWASAFTNFAGIYLYHQYTSVRTYFENQKLTYQNLTILLNADIANPYFVYPDGGDVEQYPKEIGLQQQIDEKETGINVVGSGVTLTGFSIENNALVVNYEEGEI